MKCVICGKEAKWENKGIELSPVCNDCVKEAMKKYDKKYENEVKIDPLDVYVPIMEAEYGGH